MLDDMKKPSWNRQLVMNEDRIAGAAKEFKSSVKETIGKARGDAKLEADGNAEKVEGKVQNAIGGLKDALKKQGDPGAN
jgi:uncharacterized protein YjbJ (UPF0337 family)